MTSPMRKVLAVGLGLLILFVLASSIWLDFFATSYEYGMGTEPCNKDGCTSTDTAFKNEYCTQASGSFTACTSCNATAGYETFLDSCHSLIAWNNNTHCNGCTSFGYRTTSRGLLLAIFVLAGVGIALVLFKVRSM